MFSFSQSHLSGSSINQDLLVHWQVIFPLCSNDTEHQGRASHQQRMLQQWFDISFGDFAVTNPHGLHLWCCTGHEQLKTSDPPYIIELKILSTVRHSNTYIPLRKKQMWILNYDTMLSWDLGFYTYWKVSYTSSDIDYFYKQLLFLCIHKKKNKQNNLIKILLKYFCI